MKPTWRERKRCHEEIAAATEDEAAAGVDGAIALDVPDGDEASAMDHPIFDKTPVESDNEAEPATPIRLPIPPLEDTEAENDAVELPELESIQRPSLGEYQAKWAEKFAKHSKSNSGVFNVENLCPRPISQLWQNAPHVAFDKLKSPQAQGRLALCRPISGMQESSIVDGLEKYPTIAWTLVSANLYALNVCVLTGVRSSYRNSVSVRYAHISGDVFFSRRAAWQVASTMGFVLNKNTGSFLGLTQEEFWFPRTYLRACNVLMNELLFVFVEEESGLHEVLTWGAQSGHNEILRWYGPDLASFDDSCRRLMCTFNSTLPESSLKARIRYTTRECKNLRSGSIDETLGDEAEGFVMIDFQGHPIRYDQLGGLIKQY